jgi:hypothetical protein
MDPQEKSVQARHGFVPDFGPRWRTTPDAVSGGQPIHQSESANLVKTGPVILRGGQWADWADFFR